MSYNTLSTSSGLKSASAQITTRCAGLAGIDANPPAAGYATITIYDSEDSNTSGKLVLAEIQLDAGYISVNHEYNSPVIANRGIYAVLTETGGTGTTFVARYFLM